MRKNKTFLKQTLIRLSAPLQLNTLNVLLLLLLLAHLNPSSQIHVFIIYQTDTVTSENQAAQVAEKLKVKTSGTKNSSAPHPASLCDLRVVTWPGQTGSSALCV